MQTITASLVLAALAVPGVAQIQFDLITYSKIELDPRASVSTAFSWGMLVNTGTQPFSIAHDWGAGYWYGECSVPCGKFYYSLVNPFSGSLPDRILQPGEAIGPNLPLLVAELLPGETLVNESIVMHLQLGEPYPTTDCEVHLLAQVGDQLVQTRTLFVLKDLGGAYTNAVAAKRFSSATARPSVTNFAPNCGPTRLPALSLESALGSTGPPYGAMDSNMPHVGNGNLALRIYTEFPTADYLLGFDTVPGRFPLGACELNLGMTPQLILMAGSMPYYNVVVPIPIPDDPALIGAQIFVQAALVVPGASPSVATTNTLAITIVDLLP